MLSQVVKLILGLIVVLAWPCLGWGGRAEASFALGRSALTPKRPPGSIGFELQLVLNGGEVAEPAGASSAGGMGEDNPSQQPSDFPHRPSLPCNQLPAHGGFQTSGASSGAASSAGPGVGSGLYLVLPVNAPMFAREVSGLLFLANERLRIPPFPSQLFRPPRVV